MRDNLKDIRSVLDAGSTKSDASPTKSSKFGFKKEVRKDGFFPQMERFYQDAHQTYTRLDERFTDIEKLYEGVVLLFGEDPKNMSPEEFFGTFQKFCVSYTLAKAENEAANKTEQEKREKKEKKKVTLYQYLITIGRR
jgi:hypothetical protein